MLNLVYSTCMTCVQQSGAEGKVACYQDKAQVLPGTLHIFSSGGLGADVEPECAIVSTHGVGVAIADALLLSAGEVEQQHICHCMLHHDPSRTAEQAG